MTTPAAPAPARPAAKKTVGGATTPAPAAAPTTAAPVTTTTAAPVSAAPSNAPVTAEKKKGGPGLQKTAFAIAAAVMLAMGADGQPEKNDDGSAKTVSAVNEQGKLIGVPSNYDFVKNGALKPDNFVDEPTWLEFKASVADAWAIRYKSSAAQYRSLAEKQRKHGKPEERKKIAKLEKMRAEFMKMREEAFKEGLITQAEYEKDKLAMPSVG